VAALDNEIGVIGVAPEAVLYAVKVLGNGGIGWWSDLIAGLQWCVDKGMDVANMSLGATSAPPDYVFDACDAADKSGLLLVAAAGNESGGPVIFPAAYDSVIAVSATNSADGLAYFSSIGEEVELAAPGVDIYSTYKDDGYATYSGTSMASPHVAGVAALMIAVGISDVRAQLIETADDLGEEGLDWLYGYGLVNAAKAVEISNEEPSPEPETDTMHVESITISKKKAGPNYFLYTTVKVVDGDDIALGGVRAEMTLTNGGGPWDFVGDTGSDGTVKFTLNKAPSGSYTATVTGLTLYGYDWNEEPVESELYILE
jgi:subtilisin family serine protease